MVKGGTKKPRVGTEAHPEAETAAADAHRDHALGKLFSDRRVRAVHAFAEPKVVGSAHVIFEGFEGVGEAELAVCLDEGRMVGLVITGEVTTRALHRIPLRTLERCALGMLDEAVSPQGWLPAEDRDPGVLAAIEAFERARTPIRKDEGSRDQFLARLASQYLALCSRSGSPTKTLAEERFVSPATLRDQLAQARTRGLLLPAPAGRAGGELTAKALALLATDEEA